MSYLFKLLLATGLGAGRPSASSARFTRSPACRTPAWRTRGEAAAGVGVGPATRGRVNGPFPHCRVKRYMTTATSG